jgi:inner membrane protein
MDPVTHGLVGATCAQSVSDKETFRIASLIGFLSALAPDADVFLGSSSDPLLTLELHRQFTHSLLFIPFGALIIASLLWWFVRKKLSFKTTYFLSLVGYATAGLMDYITSYGVKLFWPFLDDRFSLNIVSVFDPLLTTGILVFFVIAILKNQKIYSLFTLVWLFFYIGFAGIQKSRVQNAANEFLSKSGHELVIKPTIGNQVLWSVRYIDNEEVCSMGVRVGLFSSPVIYVGECYTLLNWKEECKPFRGTVLYNDIQRFSELSDGYLVQHPDYPNVIGDARYSMLPTTISPLWGITADSTVTDQHVSFDSYRDTSEETREKFINMILGN